MPDVEAKLAELQHSKLLRAHVAIQTRTGNNVTINNHQYINFSSNDYLGLSVNPKAFVAADHATQKFGLGATASRLICGTTVLHRQAESALARLKARPSALLLPTGYMANLALFTTLATREDAILVDRLAHASIIDAARLSAAKLLIFKHNNPDHLQETLQHYRPRYRQIFVATEAIFSMDGDMAPLPELLEICKKHHCTLILDEAHSTGVLGPHGEGLETHYGIQNSPAIIVGTCSKAIGAMGGFIAADTERIKLLISTARPHIYTTGISPSLCAAILANLKGFTSSRLQKLQRNITLFKNLIASSNPLAAQSESAIFPIIMGSSQAAIAASEQLKKQNILVVAIREPTVPAGTARLRVSINAAHTVREIKYLVKCLNSIK